MGRHCRSCWGALGTGLATARSNKLLREKNLNQLSEEDLDYILQNDIDLNTITKIC